MVMVSKYTRMVYEKDAGQATNNIYILAKRHIESGAVTDINVIKVFLSHFGLSITPVDFNYIVNIKPEKLSLPLDSTASSVLGRSLPLSHPDSKDNRIAGVYVFM
jgi:hypothetical protein